MSAGPRLFALERDMDISGISGTGIVADGVIWPDGTVSVRWRGDRPSIVHWASLDDVKAIHGHGGATRIVLPASERERLAAIAQAHCKEVVAHGMTSGYCVECGALWPCPTWAWASTDRDSMACWDPADDAPAEQSGKDSR